MSNITPQGFEEAVQTLVNMGMIKEHAEAEIAEAIPVDFSSTGSRGRRKRTTMTPVKFIHPSQR
jgi:hypothetical protein